MGQCTVCLFHCLWDKQPPWQCRKNPLFKRGCSLQRSRHPKLTVSMDSLQLSSERSPKRKLPTCAEQKLRFFFHIFAPGEVDLSFFFCLNWISAFLRFEGVPVKTSKGSAGRAHGDQITRVKDWYRVPFQWPTNFSLSGLWPVDALSTASREKHTGPQHPVDFPQSLGHSLLPSFVIFWASTGSPDLPVRKRLPASCSQAAEDGHHPAECTHPWRGRGGGGGVSEFNQIESDSPGTLWLRVCQ